MIWLKALEKVWNVDVLTKEGRLAIRDALARRGVMSIIHDMLCFLLK